MKFLSTVAVLAWTASPIVAVPPIRTCTDGFECADCVKCIGVQESGGTYQVTISATDCKNNKNISWMCCAQAGCQVLGNKEGAPGKDEETKFLSIENIPATLPIDQTWVKIQIHDGQAAGDEDVLDAYCGGNADNNGQSNTCSKVCEVDIPLSSCPTDCCNPGLLNDPHLKSWTGEWFDYMGECDLKLMRAPLFDGRQDLDIDVRTTIEYDWSYIETAALRIGDDILEVSGWGDYAVNAIEQAKDTEGQIPTIGGYQVDHFQPNRMKNHVFNVMIEPGHNITITSWKDWVSVKVIGGGLQHYKHVEGLMGTYAGKMAGRDGTEFDDINALGQDWQIRPEEASLFRVVREPQFPQKCRLPTPIDWARRLSEAETLAEEAAEQACAAFKGNAFKFCVNDVLVSGDLDMAKNIDY